MPLWRIYHPTSVFTTDESRAALASDITAIYKPIGLPEFYVVVTFVPLPLSHILVGGKPRIEGTEKPFVRITIEHIAVNMEGDQSKHKSIKERIDKALQPHIESKGYDWEYHVAETDRDLWKINGFDPPMWKSDGEKIWFKENKPVPYDGTKL
jgi:hypothetical protein